MFLASQMEPRTTENHAFLSEKLCITKALPVKPWERETVPIDEWYHPSPLERVPRKVTMSLFISTQLHLKSYDLSYELCLFDLLISIP